MNLNFANIREMINHLVIFRTQLSMNIYYFLSHTRTSGGANKDESNSKVVTAQPIMFVKGLDLLMEKLRLLEPPFEKIVGISGAGQQHGSVYWKRGSKNILNNLDPDKFLHEQLAFAFSVQHSPIWMDSSTTEYCDKIEQYVGGPEVIVCGKIEV